MDLEVVVFGPKHRAEVDGDGLVDLTEAGSGGTFVEPTLVSDPGLLMPATLMVRLGLEPLVNKMVRLRGRVGGAHPGRKVLTLVTAILAGSTERA